MAEVHPFPGILYSQPTVKEVAEVICPPYDVISEERREELYRRNEHNFIRIEYERQKPQDTETENRYTRSAATMEAWLKLSVLRTHPAPAVYLHDHHYTYRGRAYRRRGITLAVRLTPWEERSVRPHEGTLSAPKADRINVLRTLKANTSPILALFADREGNIASLLKKEARDKPLIATRPLDGESHQLWAITDSPVVNEICRRLGNEPIYIADGHHRYESALFYQQERKASLPTVTGAEAFNFVMMTLVDFTDPGLLILSPHRLIRGTPDSALRELPARLGKFFTAESLPLNLPDTWERINGLQSGTENTALVLYGLDRENLTILRQRDRSATDRMMPSARSDIYRRLDVSIFDHIILEGLLGMNAEDDMSLSYSYDRQDALERVKSGEYQLACLISPIRPDVVKAIADVRDRMPRKSTYFYPKAPAGLVFRRLV
ncbi:MAG: DUF1015 domain-containing protein [Chloroflexota bacterium]